MKHLRISALAIFLALIVAGSAMAAGSCVITRTVAHSPRADREYQLIEWAWTSDGSGDVNAASCIITGVAGYVIAFDRKPGTVTPTDAYVVTLLNQYGADVLGAKGINSSATLPQRDMPVQGVDAFVAPVNGTLELRVSAAGVTKTGTFAAYIER